MLADFEIWKRTSAVPAVGVSRRSGSCSIPLRSQSSTSSSKPYLVMQVCVPDAMVIQGALDIEDKQVLSKILR